MLKYFQLQTGMLKFFQLRIGILISSNDDRYVSKYQLGKGMLTYFHPVTDRYDEIIIAFLDMYDETFP